MNNSSEEGKVIASQSIESMQHKLARTELNFGFQTAKRSFYAVLNSQQPHRVIVSPSCLIDFSFKWKNRILKPFEQPQLWLSLSSCQAVIWQFSGSHLAVIRQSSGSQLAVTIHSYGS